MSRLEHADISCRESKDKASKTSNKAEDHKNEGFLKSAWHKLTHQHDNLDSETSDKNKPEDKSPSKDDEEPKKASGSGSG